jgi:hypothetical protein
MQVSAPARRVAPFLVASPARELTGRVCRQTLERCTSEIERSRVWEEAHPEARLKTLASGTLNAILLLEPFVGFLTQETSVLMLTQDDITGLLDIPSTVAQILDKQGQTIPSGVFERLGRPSALD